MFKFSYNFTSLDAWMSPTDGMVFKIVNQSYSFEEQSSMLFTCSISNSQNLLDVIPSGDYEFSDSPHSIWPRPYLKGDFAACRAPQAVSVVNNTNLAYQVSDNSSDVLLHISEQCQGVPINQTKVVSIFPRIDTSFLNFTSNGELDLKLKDVAQIGNYSVTIQNQVKLLNPNMTNYSVMDYIWEDSIHFYIEFSNNSPIIQTNLVEFTALINEFLTINVYFMDAEDDQVYFALDSLTCSIGYTSEITQTQK